MKKVRVTVKRKKLKNKKKLYVRVQAVVSAVSGVVVSITDGVVVSSSSFGYTTFPSASFTTGAKYSKEQNIQLNGKLYLHPQMVKY